MRYSVQPRDWMFEKGYQKGYEFFANIYSKLLVKIYEKI